MRTPNSAKNKDASSRQDVELRDLTRSMIRFTNAVTLFSIQRMQSALGTVTDSQALIDRFCDALDAISNTLSTQIDASNKSTLDRMTRTGAEVVDHTVDAQYVESLNLRETPAIRSAFRPNSAVPPIPAATHVLPERGKK
jgi:hypothetical protein